MYSQPLDLLTDTEHEVIALLAEAATMYTQQVVNPGLSHDGDIAEFVSHIHTCQNAVLAQAAARAYPDMYREAGSPPVSPILTLLTTVSESSKTGSNE